MKHLGYESGGGEQEAWIRSQLVGLSQPDSDLDPDHPEVSAAILTTAEDYNEAPEVSLSSLLGSELRLGMEEGAVHWRVIGMHNENLVVRQQGSELADEGYLVIGGSIFLPATRREMLTPEEQQALPAFAWAVEQSGWHALEDALGTPFVISTGVLCQGAHLYYHPAYALNEIRQAQIIEESLQKPLEGALISIEKQPGKTTTLFVSDMGIMSPSVNSLHRIAGDNLFQRF